MSGPQPRRVLPTLHADGTRHQIHPRPSRGAFWRRRRVVAYALIALFVALPLIPIGGKPALLIDLGGRELTLVGATFRLTDGYLLMLLGLAIALAVFLVTALAGRVWCGWACPQTVWLEWVFRPLDRLFEGGPQQQRNLDRRRFAPRRIAKYAVYVALAFLLAHTFLAYFVTSTRVLSWVTGSPAAHPIGFTVVVGVTALMFLDFAYLREQTCAIACPYGRLQAVLLDRQSLIIGYDTGRGEPRGKLRHGDPAATGDCIDCGACVTTCPAGIDIRDGLQMECIACAQCIDACAPIMQRLGRAPGLIRYTSREELSGKPRRLLRPRTIVYPALFAAIVATLVALLGHRATADVWLQRSDDAPFARLPSGEVSSPLRVRIENRTGAARTYTVDALDPLPAARLIAPRPEWPVAAGASTVVPVFVVSPADAFVHGERAARVRVRDDAGFEKVLDVTVLGPEGGSP